MAHIERVAWSPDGKQPAGGRKRWEGPVGAVPGARARWRHRASGGRARRSVPWLGSGVGVRWSRGVLPARVRRTAVARMEDGTGEHHPAHRRYAAPGDQPGGDRTRGWYRGKGGAPHAARQWRRRAADSILRPHRAGLGEGIVRRTRRGVVELTARWRTRDAHRHAGATDSRESRSPPTGARWRSHTATRTRRCDHLRRQNKPAGVDCDCRRRNAADPGRIGRLPAGAGFESPHPREGRTREEALLR